MILTTNRVPSGGVKEFDNINISVRVKRCYSALVRLVLREDEGEKEYLNMNWTGFDSGYDEYGITLNLAPGLYFYSFDLWDYGEYEQEYQLTVFEQDFTTPDWIKGGQIYQIFVDRFNRGKETPKRDDIIYHENKEDLPIFAPNEEGVVENRDFYGGNLSGITQKLDYIKSIGTTAIYLCPIFKAYSNHKYDTGDYLTIDEMFGTEEDLTELIKKADKLGIKIILDGVFNHTGDDSLYFDKYGRYGKNGAYRNEKSPYYDWYMWEKDGTYKSWWGIDTLPCTNKDNERFLSFICDKVIKKWTKMGIGAWRLDVVDELNDKLLDGIRKSVKSENKDALIIGEVWEDASNKIAYSKRRRYLQGKQLDGVMNYPFKNAIIDYIKSGNEQIIKNTVEGILANYPKQCVDVLMNFLGTHDTMRILTVLGCTDFPHTKEEESRYKLSDEEYKLGVKRLKAAAVLLMFLPGVPCIYYGDEAGVQGGHDPLNRTYFPWGKENLEILEFFRGLSFIRATHKQFEKGEYSLIYAEKGAYFFKRDNVAVGVNLGNKPIVLEGKYLNLITNTYVSEVKPFEGLVCEL